MYPPEEKGPGWETGPEIRNPVKAARMLAADLRTKSTGALVVRMEGRPGLNQVYDRRAILAMAETWDLYADLLEGK